MKFKIIDVRGGDGSHFFAVVNVKKLHVHLGTDYTRYQGLELLCESLNKLDRMTAAKNRALEALKELAAINRATPFSMFEFAAKAQALAERLEPTVGKGLIVELEDVK